MRRKQLIQRFSGSEFIKDCLNRYARAGNNGFSHHNCWIYDNNGRFHNPLQPI